MTQHRNYDLLLMDADGTLFDYERAEQHALTSALRDFGLVSDLDSLTRDYQRINAQLWADWSRGKSQRMPCGRNASISCSGSTALPLMRMPSARVIWITLPIVPS